MALTAAPRPVGPSVWDGVSLHRSPRRAPVAVGGTMDPATLVGAYRVGAFPWPSDEPADDATDVPAAAAVASSGATIDESGDLAPVEAVDGIVSVYGYGATDHPASTDGRPGGTDGQRGSTDSAEPAEWGLAEYYRMLRAAVAARRIRHLSPQRPGGYDLPWWSPDPRAVIPAGGVRVSRSLRKRLRGCGWTTSIDEAFVDVVRGCQRDGTSGWITDELLDGYAELHALGWAHSIEVWDGDELVGGMYGVGIGGVFAGESMFHARTDASKIALADFDARFRAGGGVLLDVQLTTEHLISLGARDVPRRDYLAVLAKVRDDDVRLTRDRLPVSRLAPPTTS
ncbi:leucyl/phenylalanyl-tRNA--protein transferase [Frankia sp. Ag45/Mut15]|uniref:Leucyl/phenylalanyl-tRNA--protein transferase n=1 Tax=Frankia umida TaxID=573489 RepID=A0ABT0JW93_9ACTN|nr:leucyl/phenylalanyl-tRNA--protein transferase [Frankia umida]MCK9875812.1 leucyl/phenylalanyl-tRNA--protein transferase [Frankia umida]